MSSRRPTLRPHLGLLGLGLLVLVSSGCVQIPDSGGVQEGYPVNTQQEPVLIQFQPGGPQASDPPPQIVEGFLTAMQAYPPSSLVAREFLTPRAAARWQPAASTQIYSDRVTSAAKGGRVDLEGTRIGRLSGRGTWTSASAGGDGFRHRFQLTRVRGEWRIGNPPAGALVSDAYFERYYRPYALYFFDPSHNILVPDPVYLPDGPQTPTLLVQGLLGGPTDWLAGGVDTLLPVATKVDLSVPVSPNGVAEVPLSEDVRRLAPEDRQLVLAQLVWTLRQVPQITGVRILVEGSELEIPGSSGVATIDTLPGFDPAGLTASRQLFGIRADRVVTVTGSEVSAVPGPLGTGRRPSQSVAVDLDGERGAVVSGNGTVVRVADISAAGAPAPAPTRWYAGSRVLAPSWDRTGRLWLVDMTARGAKVVVLDEKRQEQVAVPKVSGRVVRALKVSRDGVRLAAIVGTGPSARLVVGRVDRGSRGQVEAVNRVHRVTNAMTRLSRPTDVAWNSPTTVVVNARSGAGSRQPFLVAVDGSSIISATALPDVGVTDVAAAPNSDLPVVVGTSAGRLWTLRADLTWTRTGGKDRIRSPVYPG